MKRAALLIFFVFTASLCYSDELPVTWVDKDTGHRVWKISSIPYSTLPYFTVNVFTKDGREMIYRSQNGIYSFDLESKQSRILVERGSTPQVPQIIGVGRHTGNLYLTMPDNKTHETRVLSVDVSTRVATEVGRLPITYSVQTINADETLIAGAFVAPDSGKGNYRDIGPKLYGSKKKGAIAYAKFNLKETRVVYLYDLRTRQTSELFRSNYLVSNLQFSPTSPNLLMYCHEGPWHAVDRIWTIATDEKNKTLIHKRTMVAGIVGHEFWSEDGDSIWYDWQAPRGQVFYIAGKNIIDNQRYAYVLDRAAWSIHYARAPDGAFFVGDGGDKKQVARSDAPRYTQVIENLPQDPLTYQSCLNFERNRGKDVEKYAFRNATTAEQAP